MFVLIPCALGQSPRAEAQEAEPTEVLVFTDGDRTQGRLIGRDGEFLVFQSVRFGELRVPASEATIQPLEKPEQGTGPTTPPATAPSTTRSEEGSGPPARSSEVVSPEGAPGSVEMPDRGRPHWTSPAALALALRDFLGPWEGRLALSASVLTNNNRNEDFSAELRFRRRWTRDEARFTLNYDLSRTNGARDTDRLKGNGVFRHDFRDRPLFINYRPTVEWNREFQVANLPADYVLLQQEIGLGVNFVRGEDRALRLGIAENIFDVWTLPDDRHTIRDNQSLFAEVELRLPWRITLTDRTVWYYSIDTKQDGWENRFEVTKKFTDALSLGVRHELRRDNPDPKIADFTLWRLLLGLDF